MYAFVNMSSIFPTSSLNFLIYLKESQDTIWMDNITKITKKQDILNEIIRILKYK